MSEFISGICKADQAVHTRVGECSMFEDTPLGLILHNKNVPFTLDETTFNTELKSGIKAAGINRVTPLIGGVTDYQPTGGDVRTSQEGFGPETPIGINAKRVDYVLTEGGLCLYKQLKRFNGKQMRIILVDMQNVAYGTAAIIDGSLKFRGFLAKIWVTKRDNTGSQGAAIIFSVFYDASYENEESHLVSLALAERYEGLTGVVLKRTGAGEAKFVIACSGDDLTSTFGTLLGTATLYKDKAGLSPTAIAYNATTEVLTFTPATGSYKVLDAATLNAAGIEGYEGEDEYTNLT